MTARALVFSMLVASLAAPHAFARQASSAPTTQSSPQGRGAAPPAEPRPTAQSINVKVDVTIAEQHAGTAGPKKTVSVVVADTFSGRIRSTASYAGGIGDVPLNVDADATLLPDGKIRLHVNLQYDLPASTIGAPSSDTASLLRRTQLGENLAVIVENGKPMMVAQSADPVGDRQVTIEVKATVLR